MSTFYNPKYALSAFIDVITVDGNQEVDLFNPKISKLIASITSYQNYVYSDADKLVNISWKYYNTTSLWWLILAYNGLIHPYEIPNGLVLKIPDLFDFQQNVNLNTNNIGNVVTL